LRRRRCGPFLIDTRRKRIAVPLPRFRYQRAVCESVSSGNSGNVARGGWRRLGRRRFRYVDSRGRAIQDDEHLERIAALAIPPAWTEVWISPNPHARLQATGVDSAGRKQYLYSAAFRAAQDREKYERLLAFAKALPRLRRRMSAHLRTDPFEPDWTCAVATGVINKAWFRVGSDRHARSSRTYGVTTLRKRHVTVSGDEIAFCFRAKNRRLVRRTITNEVLARSISALLDLPDGSRLFRFERDDELVPLTAPLLNEYLAENLGDGYTAKDFRTWGGTLVAATELARRGPAKDETQAKQSLAAVMRRVGDELGNTAAVARAAYVSPVVVEHYLAGTTLDDFRSVNGARPARLTLDEQALLRLLRTPLS
jgi:DNA topoisomerase-1